VQTTSLFRTRRDALEHLEGPKLLWDVAKLDHRLFALVLEMARTKQDERGMLMVRYIRATSVEHAGVLGSVEGRDQLP